MVVKCPCPVKGLRTPSHQCECDTDRRQARTRESRGTPRARRRGTMDEARAREVLAAARVLPGSAGEARLLALGENAVFAAGDLAVKVGRDAELLERARRELAVALWLEEAGVPAVRAAGPEALIVDGHPVTVWRRLPEPVRPTEPRDVAALLRLVHELPLPSSFELPPRELLGGVERWLRLAGDVIDPADAAYLRARRDGFASAAAALTPHLQGPDPRGRAAPQRARRSRRTRPDRSGDLLRRPARARPRGDGAEPGPLRAARRGVRRLHRDLRLGRARVGRLRRAPRAGRPPSCLGRPARAEQSEGPGRVRAPGGVAAGRGPRRRRYPF
ncbi:hypothetical protein STENM223S_07056 [Streptomyces tendae]